MLQFCTALFAFAGTAVGLLFETDAGANGKVLAAVSGGFVYLATMTVLPELLEPLEEEDDDEKDHQHSDITSGTNKNDDDHETSPEGTGMVTRSARKRAGKGANPSKLSEGSSSSASSSRAELAPPQQPEPWLSKQANAVLVQTSAEAIAFGTGVYMMVLVAKLEVHEH